MATAGLFLRHFLHFQSFTNNFFCFFSVFNRKYFIMNWIAIIFWMWILHNLRVFCFQSLDANVSSEISLILSNDQCILAKRMCLMHSVFFVFVSLCALHNVFLVRAHSRNIEAACYKVVGKMCRMNGWSGIFVSVCACVCVCRWKPFK